MLNGAEVFSQNICAYVDYKNYFYAFDDGASKQLEFNPIQQYKIGGNAIVYVDYSGTVKVYYNGETNDLRIQSPKEIIATDDLIFIYSAGVLKVFDQGDVEVASPNTNSYFPGDSLIGFFDNNTYALKVYYKKEVSSLEDYIGGGGGRAVAGDNILAWVNKEDHFKVFWQGETYELESTPPDNFRAAMNTLAYIDKFTQAFKVFYKGKTVQLESYRPKHFQVGDNMVVYVDNTGHFKIFYDGATWDASAFEPPFYKVEDNILVFGDYQHFMVFYKGKTYQLESYAPTSYKVDYSTVAYVDRDGYLKVFQDGLQQKVSEEKINSFELSRNILRFTTGLDQNNFFSRGKTY
jgi:hypothetical protein